MTRRAIPTSTDGFTLVELLVAVAIIGILAAVGLYAFMHALDSARQRATMGDMRAISKAIEIYGIDYGFFPNTNGDMDALKAILIPIQSSVVPIHDHWNNGYHYVCEGGRSYTLESYGKDGVDGADISIATRTDFTRDIVLVNGEFVAAPE
jgi:type II secretion system protein G